MKLLVLVSVLVAAESAQLQSYSSPSLDRSTFNHGVTSTAGVHSGTSFGQGNTFVGQGTSNVATSFGQGSAFSGQRSNDFASSFGQGSSNAVFGQGSTSTRSFAGNSNAVFGQGSTSTRSFSGNSNAAFGQGTTSFIGSGFSPCRDGEVLHVDGRCVVPEVSRNFYAFTVPEQPQSRGPRPFIPPPKEEQNILFVHLPEEAGDQDPIIVPPPRQNNIVYILKKKSGQDGQKVINLPQQPRSNPEVYYVNYSPGENPTLLGGIDLQTALSNAAQGTGQVIGGSTLNDFGTGQATGGFGVNAFAGFQSGQATGGFGSNSFDFSQTGQATSGFGSTDFGFSSVDTQANRIQNQGNFNSFGGNNFVSSLSAPSNAYTTS